MLAEKIVHAFLKILKFFNCISAGAHILWDMIILPAFYFNNQEYINIKKTIINM